MPRSDGCRRIRASQISRAVNCLRFLNIRPPLRAFYFPSILSAHRQYIRFLKCVYLPAFFLTTPRLFLLPYCPPLQPFPSVPIVLLPAPLAAARLPLTGHHLPTIQTPSNDTNSLKRYKLPQTVQTLPNGTTSPKRLIHLFCPQHSLKTKIAIEF